MWCWPTARRCSLTAVWTLANDWTPQTLSLSMASKQMQRDLFHALWPRWLQPATRQWVADQIPSGVVQDATLSLTAKLDGAEPQIKMLTGSLAMANAEITLTGAAPAMTNVYGKLSLETDMATIVHNQANIADLALQYGWVTIPSPLAGTVPQAEVKMAFKEACRPPLPLVANLVLAGLVCSR